MPSKRLIQQAKKALPKTAPKAAQDFLEQFYAKVMPEDLRHITPQDMADIAMTHMDMIKKRNGQEPVIRIEQKASRKNEGLGFTALHLLNEDMTFLVDSIAARLSHDYKYIDFLIHPIIYGKTNKSGVLQKVEAKPSPSVQTLSHMYIELHGMVADNKLDDLKNELLEIIKDVRCATRDWLLMKDKIYVTQAGLKNAPCSKLEKEEYISFLDYVLNDNFTLLGYREYKFTEKKGKVESQVVNGESLGILSDERRVVYKNKQREKLTPDLQSLRKNQDPLTVCKANRRATVHRPVPMDAIAVKQYDKKGNVTGEHVFLGLFTSVTYSRSINDIPLLRRKADQAIALSGFKEGSHNDKGLHHILEKYPRDELFQISIEQLLETSLSILSLQERQRIALYVRPDPFGRYVSCLVYVPRDRFETKLRLKMAEILEDSFSGDCGSFYVNVDDSPSARVLFIITVNESDKLEYDVDEIEAELQKAGELWPDALANAVHEMLDDEREVAEIVDDYGESFPQGYRDHYTPKQAYHDIKEIRRCISTNHMISDFFQPKGSESHRFQLKMFHPGKPVHLSAVLPILENMGVGALSELPFKICPPGPQVCMWMHDFLLELKDKSQKVDPKGVKYLFQEALAQAWRGNIDNDELNSLVLAGVPWRHIVILRTYVYYMRQTKLSYDTSFILQTLVKHPQIAKSLVKLFTVRFDPSYGTTRAKDAKAAEKAIHTYLTDVSSLDEDTIFRSVLTLIKATLRTNFYQKNEDGSDKAYLSVKLDCKEIPDLPRPKPYREMFVYSPRVEGVHLRGDVIARGGIRWSDRHEDYRTEVLGLMKAQQVKNSVIVPMGAKGGFIVKNPPESVDRSDLYNEGVACYKIFIAGLLDITDNRVGNKVKLPKDVVRYDDDDPYLVVAADKGTASFSDIANSISQHYGFWLGDAFASGGSAGYDHKKMGITARGAWESVKRHFRELTHDIQTQNFDVVGIGDMGGDVFGNGMLLSKHIRLVGAFNHLHIFCDPDPDPLKSFKERQRMFKGVKGWDNYNKKLLSKGGRIYNRSDKSLTLTPEIQKSFGLKTEKVTPDELMRAMLKARVDLLWFGGIGTYVKATTESDLDVGDKGNDRLRIDATELKARVIGEGANLAVTQLARVEYAQKGGKVNADFIDNSGGVDSSDHEVNIKILFSDVIRDPKNKMSIERRNKILESMTDTVADLVLQHNYNQSQGISLVHMNAADRLAEHSDLIVDLEKRVQLSRKLENLPNRADIEIRMQNGQGLTRPEIATLISYSKIELTRDILKSDIPDQSHIEEQWLVTYFPKVLQKDYHQEILRHRLKREIIATHIASSIVNRMGPTFIDKTADKAMVSRADVVRAYLMVIESIDALSLWHGIQKLDNKVLAHIQLKAMQSVSDTIERLTLLILRRYDVLKDPRDLIKKIKGSVDAIEADGKKILTTQKGREIASVKEDYKKQGFPVALGDKLAMLPILKSVIDIIQIKEETNMAFQKVSTVFLSVGEIFEIEWFVHKARALSTKDVWEREAQENIINRFVAMQSRMTERVLREVKGKPLGKKTPIEYWCDKNKEDLDKLFAVFEEFKTLGALDLAEFIIAEQRLNDL